MKRLTDETFTRTLSKADPKGFEAVTGLNAVKNLTAPAESHYAVIQCVTADVRWRDDGPPPTAAIGMLLKAGAELVYTGDLSNIKFIETAINAGLNVSYYG